MRDLLKAYRKSAFAAALLICYLGALLWSSLDVQRQLEQKVLSEHRLELEKDASAISYVLSERRNDLVELAESGVVGSYFGNFDLGMSLEYGLGVNIQAIEARFDELIARKRFGEKAIYTAFVLVDDAGRLVASSGNEEEVAMLVGAWSAFLADESVQMLPRRERLLLAAPVQSGSRVRGHVAASTDLASINARLADARSGSAVAVAEAQSGEILWSRSERGNELELFETLIGKATGALVTPVDATGLADADHATALIEAPVADSPLVLVSLLTESQFDSRPWPIVVSMGVFAVPLIAIFIVILDFRSHRRSELAREAQRLEAERAAKARSEFLANMSHEIRTPLNAILGLAQVGERESRGRATAQVYRRIIESGRHLLGVINDVLDFSKIEAGKLLVEQTPMSPGEVIDRVVTLSSLNAQAKGLGFAVSESMLPARCIGDPQRLTQVLVNLLSNAIKFTERGGVALEAQARAGRLEFVVSDSGVGMTSEQIGRVFSPFEQADGSTTRRFGGTGLGLSISERLVRSMGGLIQVSSEPGKGSRFEVRIPLVAPQAASAPQPGTRVCLHGMDEAEAAMVVRELGAQGIEGRCCTLERDLEGAAMVVLEASSVMTVAGNKDAAVPQAVLDRAELRIGLLGDVTVLDAIEIPPALQGRIILFERPFRARHLAAALHEDVAVPTTRADTRQPLAGLHLMVVDDHALNRLVLSRLLEQEGASLECFESAGAALERLRNGGGSACDVVLSDVQMPEMDGYELAAIIAASYPALPVIGLTAHTLSEDRARCLRAGMREHVAKPVDIDVLVAAILRHAPHEAGMPELASGRARRAEAASAQPLAASDVLIDWAEIERRFGNKAAFVTRLAGTALESYETAAEALRSPETQADSARIALIAHNIKSSAGTLKVEHLYQLAMRTDAAAREARPEAAGLAAELAAALDGAITALRTRVAGEG